MKTLSTFTLLIFFSILTSAQSFAPIGTKWGFNYIQVGGVGTYYLESVGDTVIAGRNCRKLVTQDIFYICPTCPSHRKNVLFIHERNDSLFSVNTLQQQFNLLFRYNLQLGDTFTNSSNLNYLVTRKVDTLIRTTTLKKWELKSICSDPRYKSENINFIQNIGSTSSILGLGSYCFSDPVYYTLCQFSSTNIQIGAVCSYTNTHELAQNIPLSIQPNPALNSLKIDTKYPFDFYKIFDLTGKCLHTGNYTEGVSIDVSHLKNGIFILQLIDNKQLMTNQKFVKL